MPQEHDPNKLYQTLTEHMQEAVAIVDKKDKTVYVNEQFCDLTGYSLEELQQMAAMQIFDKESAKLVKKLHEQEREKGVSSSYEATILAKSGDPIPVHVTGTPLKDGSTMGIMTDLRKSKQQEIVYRQLVEHMQEGVWMGDPDNNTIYANPRYCEMAGYSLEEIQGLPESTFWTDESAEKIDAVNTTERSAGESSIYEVTMQSKDGEEIPVMVSGTPLPEGGTIAIINDLRPLRKQESMYRNLVENMQEAVWMVDKYGRTAYVNPRFCEMMGFSEEEVIGVDSYQFIHPDHLDMIRRIDESERQKGVSSSYEATFIAKNGKEIPLLVSGTPTPDGGSMGIMNDLTAVKEKQKQEHILNKAIAYATDGIIIIDEDGKVQAWNKGAKIIFGYEQDELMGSTLNKIFSEEDVSLMLKQSSVRYNFELRGTHKNEQEIAISATLTPVFNDDKKKMSSVLLIARDITAQRKFEEELSLKYQKMKEAYNQFGVVRRQVDYIFELCEACSEYQDIGAVADFIVNSIIMLTRVDGCVLRVYDKKKDSIDMISSFGVNDNWKGKTSVAYPGSLIEKAFKQDMPLKIVDVTKEPMYNSTHLARMHNFSSLLVIPLTYQNELVGGITMYVTPEKKLELFENDFMEQYATLIGLIIACKSGKC